MKHVWTVVDTKTNDTIALYNTQAIAEKLAPLLAKKLDTETKIEKRTINLSIEYIGTKR